MCTVIWKDYPNAPALILLTKPKALNEKAKSKMKQMDFWVRKWMRNCLQVTWYRKNQNYKVPTLPKRGERGFCDSMNEQWQFTRKMPQKENTQKSKPSRTQPQPLVPWSGKGNRSLIQKVSQIPWWKQTSGPGPRPFLQPHRLQMQVQGSVRRWSL